jgi:hypothetical protein
LAISCLCREGGTRVRDLTVDQPERPQQTVVVEDAPRVAVPDAKGQLVLDQGAKPNSSPSDGSAGL